MPFPMTSRGGDDQSTINITWPRMYVPEAAGDTSTWFGILPTVDNVTHSDLPMMNSLSWPVGKSFQKLLNRSRPRNIFHKKEMSFQELDAQTWWLFLSLVPLCTQKEVHGSKIQMCIEFIHWIIFRNGLSDVCARLQVPRWEACCQSKQEVQVEYLLTNFVVSL